MVPNQLSLTRLAHAIHAERIEPATAHPSCDDEWYLRPATAESRPQPRSLLGHLSAVALIARARRVAGQAS